MTKNKKARPQAKRMGGRKIKGKGNYSTFNLRGMAQKLDQALSAIPKGTFAKKGAQMGAKYGPLGALAGKGLGAGLAAVTGYGNYSVRSNSLSKVSTSVDMVPQFVKNDHSIRVTHREFIKDIVVPAGPADFSLQAHLINPANKDLFPWLATMARQYSQYKIHGMVFAYKTMSSDITAGGALGTVIMATNYNSIDRTYLNKIEMENSEFAVSTKPSMSMIHAIECDPKYSGLDVLYVRDPSYETTDQNDKRFYDYGKFQLATTGLPGTTNTVMGELWVSYDIEFMKPVIGGTGLPTLVPGACLISKSDGTYGVGATSRGFRVSASAAAETPVVGSTVNVLAASYPNTSGDTGIIGTAFSVDGTAITFKRNGNFTIALNCVGAVGNAANINYAASNSVKFSDFVVTTTGSATGTLRQLGSVIIPAYAYPVISSNAYGYTIAFNIIVSNASDTSTVICTPASFALQANNVIASITKGYHLTWYAAGTNDQTTTFVQ